MTPPPYVSIYHSVSGSVEPVTTNSIVPGSPWNKTRSPLRISSPVRYRIGIRGAQGVGGHPRTIQRPQSWPSAFLWETCREVVIGYNHSPFIVVAKDVMAAAGARQAKPIRVQCANQLPR